MLFSWGWHRCHYYPRFERKSRKGGRGYARTIYLGINLLAKIDRQHGNKCAIQPKDHGKRKKESLYSVVRSLITSEGFRSFPLFFDFLTPSSFFEKSCTRSTPCLVCRIEKIILKNNKPGIVRQSWRGRKTRENDAKEKGVRKMGQIRRVLLEVQSI